MLHYEGEKGFSLPPAELGAKLSDARFLVQCVPGVEEVLRAEPGVAEFRLHPGFSFVRGTLAVTLSVLEAKPGEAVRLRVVGKGIGSGSTVEAALALAPGNPGTHVRWTADVTELSGLLKALPRGLIQASAQKVLTDVWAAVENKLGAEVVPGAGG
jgi:carbon monoxide dehydrogenase subunit G